MDIQEFRSHLWQLFRAIGEGLDAPLTAIVQAHGITMGQMRILVEVQRRDQVTVGELSDALGTAPANTSATCKTLEKKGLVNRDRSAEDERIVLISLTLQGKSLLKVVEKELSAIFDPVLQEFSPSDFQQIIQGMEKLKEVVTRLHQAFQTTQVRR